MLPAGGGTLILFGGLLWLLLRSSSPSQVLESALSKANSGNYSAANQETSFETRGAMGSALTSQAIWDSITRKGSISKVVILNEEVRGEGATVRFKLLYKDGSSFEAEERLLKEDGKWKLSMVHLLQARMFDQKDDAPAKAGPNRTSSSKPKPPVQKSKPLAQKVFDGTHIEPFLGISSDFKVCAMSSADGVQIVDLDTGKNLASPKWDRDWGRPRSIAFGKGVIAAATGRESVKVFSRITGELEQNVLGQVDRAMFSADGRFLAITGFRPGNGYHLVLRDIQERKTFAELRLGGNGYCTLTVAGRYVAAHESNEDQITIVEAMTGKPVSKLKAGILRNKERLGESRMPLAISPTGNLIAVAVMDAVVVYDLDAARLIHRLEGHLDIVRAVSFSFDGEIVATAARDKTIRFWRVKEGREIHAIKNLATGASELIFSADGKRLAIVFSDDDSSRGRKAEIRSLALK